MSFTVAEALQRAWDRAARGLTEAESRLFLLWLESYTADALRVTGDKVAAHPSLFHHFQRTYAIPVAAGTGGCSLRKGAAGAAPDPADLLVDTIRHVSHSSGVPCKPLAQLYQFESDQPICGVIWYIVAPKAIGGGDDYRLRTIDGDGARDAIDASVDPPVPGLATLDGSTFYIVANFIPTIADLDANPQIQTMFIKELERIARAQNDAQFAADLLGVVPQVTERTL